jgi:hypothetical protein
LKKTIFLRIIATQQRDPSPSLFSDSNNPEHTRIYNQAVLLNSLIRSMVNESGIQNSSSNESCCSNDTQVKEGMIDFFKALKYSFSQQIGIKNKLKVIPKCIILFVCFLPVLKVNRFN